MSEEEIEAIEELKEQIKQDTAELPYSEESLQYKQTILNLIDKLQKENEDMREELQMYVDTPINKLIVENKKLKEEIEFQKNQRKLWRDNYYQQIDQIYNEKELINKEAEIMRDNTIKIFTAQDIIKAKFQVIDKLLGESNE